MASDPRSLGARIRSARQRRHLTQPQLAEAMEVSVRAVGDWENNRTRPKNRLGALEAFFGVNLTEPDNADVYTDTAERAIWDDESIPESERRAVIEEIRELRSRYDRRRYDRRQQPSA